METVAFKGQHRSNQNTHEARSTDQLSSIFYCCLLLAATLMDYTRTPDHGTKRADRNSTAPSAISTSPSQIQHRQIPLPHPSPPRTRPPPLPRLPPQILNRARPPHQLGLRPRRSHQRQSERHAGRAVGGGGDGDHRVAGLRGYLVCLGYVWGDEERGDVGVGVGEGVVDAV